MNIDDRPINPNFSKIAIVGISFRFPGDICEESAFWEALKDGKDLIGKIPAERWAVDELQHDTRSEPGRSITFSAGVLSRIDEFDASFFGISPREAAWMDPQQRLLLEMSWEAMENANIQPSSLAGSDCAVYVGISSLDYGTRGLDDLASMSSHSMTGNTLSIAANRLSYVFDLHGPSLAVDTACSSSLVALDHACRALNTGAVSTALVGGVNLLLHPYPFVGFTKASMLSADGRCKSFDASGNGYVRSEGGAVLLLKPLEKALADGDEIHAVILGTGTNSDGSRKTGITIPSSQGQVELMRSVLSKTGLFAQDIDFVEAHGTGTSVGDPIETAAIGEVYGKEREEPLPIGSVKANLGHMEPASGMAGIVKTILSLKNRALPPQIHIKELNNHIDFSGLNIEPVQKYMKLEKDESKALIAGVNSFGFGGTNAHVLLQEYRKVEQNKEKEEFECEVTPPLFLSARSDAALRALAGSYADLFKLKTQKDYYDIAFGTAYKRSRMEKRLAILAKTSAEVEDKLTKYSEYGLTDGIVFEEALSQNGGLAFIYSGNGSQWIGMGQRLLSESEQFTNIMIDLDSKIQDAAGFSLLSELLADEESSNLDDTVIAQPLLFAIQVAITLMLKEQGVEPIAVAGHSVGEVAAAWAAGALDLNNAIRVIVARSQAQGETRGTGRMAAVGLSVDAMQEVMTELGGISDLNIAGINSPNNITLSGSLVALTQIQKHLEAKGIFFRLLDLDYAFHSEYMDPIRKPLVESLFGLESSTTEAIDFVSTVTGEILDGKQLDANYWWHNVREPVRFADALTKLVELDCRIFVEIGPHAILQRYISESLEKSQVQGRILATLRKDNDGLGRIEETALSVHLLAEKAKYDNYFPNKGKYIKLPNYRWQRERYWHPKTSEALLSIERRRVHPLLGWQIPEAEFCWENVLDTTIIPWLSDHKVGDAIVFPGAAYAELALAAAKEWLGNERLLFEELNILSPMVFNEEHARTLRFELNTRDGNFQIKSKERLSSDEWTLHASGRILEASSYSPSRSIDTLPDTVETVSHTKHYEMASSLGLEYGKAFSGIDEVKISGNLMEAKLKVSDDLKEKKYFIHPGVLDLCYQSLIDFSYKQIADGEGVALLPVKTGILELYKQSEAVKFRARITRRNTRSVQADFELYDVEENLIARVYGCRFKAAPLQNKKQEAVESWSIIPWLQPHPSETLDVFLPSSREILEHIQKEMQAIKKERTAWFQEAFALFEALVLSFAYEAFKQIKDKGELQNLLLSSDLYTRWLISLLESEELLASKEGKLVLEDESDLPSADEIWRTLLQEYPNCLPQLTLFGRIGRQLPKLLQKEINKEEFVSSLLNSSAMEMMYDNDPAYFGVRYAVETILKQIAQEFPNDKRLRILEICEGASELPHTLLSTIPEEKLDYVLALPNEAFVARQEAEYAEYANLSVATFDYVGWNLETDKELPEHFDLIVIRHSLHRATNLKVAFSQIKKRLCKGGALVVAERYPDWSADFIAGLDKKWWQNNALESSLMSSDEWKKILEDERFEEIESFNESVAEGLHAGSYIILAKNSQQQELSSSVATESSSWLFIVDDGSTDFVEKVLKNAVFARECVTVSRELPLEKLNDFDNIVYLTGWNQPIELLADLSTKVIQGIQKIANTTTKSPKLWFTTRGGALASKLPNGYVQNPLQTSLWGLGRVVMNEYPGLHTTLIDIQYGSNLDAFVKELLQPDGVNEILLTDNGRYTLLMRKGAKENSEGLAEDERYHLDFHTPGQLRNAVWMADKQQHDLGNKDIEVQVCATGLNFRDVMYLMGLLPDEAVENGFAGASLGMEFSGIITKIGTGVEGYQVGDSVMGLASACFSSHIVTRSEAITPMPQEWSYEAAVTVPIVFLTVYYSLIHLADLQPNESVLIHGGAGGVGIAAIQLAKHFGAKVFATAGSEEKRDFVSLLGVENVFDSRSLSFADDVMAATNGEGVDIVLNSLSGEAIRRNLSILKPFGRFLELGKRDFFENTAIGLRPFRNNVSYFGVDADQLLVVRPKLVERMYQELMPLFHKGALSPIPYRVFQSGQVVDAFRYMWQSRHIGKIVVSMANSDINLEASAQNKQEIRFISESTWIVTGGVSGFGLESAKWLAKRGVGNLVLVSRNASEFSHTDAIFEELKGVNLHTVSCDVTDKEAVFKLVENITRTMPPLKGVLHAAAVYDDALIQNLDPMKVQKVIAPKFLGAWNLHLATKDLALDNFILYSSVTTAIGNPGQANYVSANAALEGLTGLRRSLGLPVTSVSWGAIGDVGYLARNEDIKESLSGRLGKVPLSSQKALEMLDDIWFKDTIVADLDWTKLSRTLPSSETSRFSLLNLMLNDNGLTEDETDFRALIGGKSFEETAAIVEYTVTREVARVLAIDANKIEKTKPLHDLGLDSLMAVELSLSLEERMEIKLPVMVLNESPTVEKVSKHMMQKLFGDSDVDTKVTDNSQEMFQTFVKQHGLNEDEIMTLQTQKSTNEKK